MHHIRTVLVGTGFMGWVHLEALRRLNIEVAGIAASSLAKAQDFAHRHGVARAYASLEEALADPTVQVVHLCVPNRHHYPMAKAALEANKHVLCEKPLAMNSTESAELVRCANAKPHLACGVNYNIRYYPLCLEARERVRSGSMGKVLHVAGSYSQDWLLLETDYNWRVLDSEGGDLRAVADIGTHWLDLAWSITGLEVESVCADLQVVHSSRKRPKGEVETFQSKQRTETMTESIPIHTDDYGSVLLRYRGGARGVMWVSQTFAGRKNCLRLEIASQKNSLAFNSEKPNEIWFGHRDRANELLIRDPALLTDKVRPFADYPGGHNEGYDDSFKMCFRDFYGSIVAGKTGPQANYPTFADGHREILLCEAILKSQREGRWVTVGEQR
jgi:predicted dehydrogenase